MEVNFPGGLATVSYANGVVTLATPIDGSSPTGMMTIVLDTNVTKAAVESLIAGLQSVVTNMS